MCSVESVLSSKGRSQRDIRQNISLPVLFYSLFLHTQRLCYLRFNGFCHAVSPEYDLCNDELSKLQIDETQPKNSSSSADVGFVAHPQLRYKRNVFLESIHSLARDTYRSLLCSSF